MQTFNILCFAAVTVCALGGCSARPQPLSVSRCDVLIEPSSSVLDATITSHAEKPVRTVEMQLDFYQNYRFTRATASLTFNPVFDPGTTRQASAPLSLKKPPGPAMHCIASHIVYGDGTTSP
jgi:hypothetical protein